MTGELILIDQPGEASLVLFGAFDAPISDVIQAQPIGELVIFAGQKGDTGATGATGPAGPAGPAGGAGASYATRALLVTAIAGGLTLTNGSLAWADGIAYKWSSGATAVPSLPNLIPVAPVTPEHFGAVGDNTTNDLAAFNAMIAYGHGPLRLRNVYRVSTYPSANDLLFEIESSAALNIDGGLIWLPKHYIDIDTVIYQKKTLPAGTNPVTVDPVAYDLIETSYMNHRYLINQWGRQVVGGGGATTRTGVNLDMLQMVHSGEGDGYTTFWSLGASPHSRIGSAVSWNDQNSTGMANGQVSALGNQVNLYGIGDIVLEDGGFTSVALVGQVTYLYANGADGAYDVPRFGHLIRNFGSRDIDASYIAIGKQYVAFDASGATVSGAVLAMAEGQAIAFGATPNASGGKFSTQAVGNYLLKKPTGQNAVELGFGADEIYGFRVAGLSATVRAAFGVSGSGAYVTAFSSGADTTFLAFRTASAGTEIDRLVIGTAGDLNLLTAGRALQFNSVMALRDGTGTPEGVVTAAIGAAYLRRDGGASSSLYVKESGAGNTGWAAMLSTAGGTVSGNLTITGNLVLNGTTYTVNATTVTYDDIILVIGGDTAPVADDAKDRGIEFRWHDGTSAKLGFFGWDRSAQEFTFIPDATDAADVLSGTVGTIRARIATPASAAGGAGINIGEGAAPSSPVNGDIWITSGGMSYRYNGATRTVMPTSGGTFSGAVVMPAPTVGGASFRIPHGTAPSAAADGGLWTTTTAFFARINGVDASFVGVNTGDETGAGILTKIAAAPGGGGTTNFVRADGTFAAPAGGAAYTIGTTAPGSPVDGQKWFNTTLGAEFTWLTSAWVETGNGVSLARYRRLRRLERNR